MVPNLFCLKGHLFFIEGTEGHKVIFCIPLPFSTSFHLSSFPPVQQLGVLGERGKLPQRGLGRSLSRQRILKHSRKKVIVFDMFREILQRSKQLEIFRFLPRISYFHHNGHSGSYPTGLPCQNGNSAVVAHLFFKFFRGSRATF